MLAGTRAPPVDARWIPDEAPFGETRSQLDECFAGERSEFHVPLAREGSPFQRAFWGRC